MQIVRVNPKKIIVKNRHRRDMGNINLLADDIANFGLLEPIGITSDNVLVYGERRLTAIRDHLVRDEIEALIVDTDFLLCAEFSENLVRKEWEISELISMGEAIKVELSRADVPTQKKAAQERFQAHYRRLLEDKAKIGSQRDLRTDDILALALGFSSTTNYLRAVKVVKTGNPKLVSALDSKAVEIKTLARVAEQPDEVSQNEALEKEVKKKAESKKKQSERMRKPKAAKSEKKVSTEVDHLEAKAQEIINEFGIDAVIIAEKIFKHFSAD
jgi:ParB family transcriptional regulator, chromosome partitioning protein